MVIPIKLHRFTAVNIYNRQSVVQLGATLLVHQHRASGRKQMQADPSGRGRAQVSASEHASLYHAARLN